jgi:hypothetical protein
MNLGDFLEGLFGGLVATEAFDWSGRLAQKIIPTAVRLWTSGRRGARYRLREGIGARSRRPWTCSRSCP